MTVNYSPVENRVSRVATLSVPALASPTLNRNVDSFGSFLSGNADRLSPVREPAGNLASAFSSNISMSSGSERDPLSVSGLPVISREPGNIYVTGHRVGGGPYHTAIEYVDSSNKSSWLSAGPSGTSNEGLVSLVGAPNRIRANLSL